MTVSTLNAWGIPYWGERRTQRFTKIASASRELDVLALQEVFFDSESIADNLANGYEVVRLPSRFPWLHSGVMFVTRHKPQASRLYRFEECGGFQCLVDRGLLYMRIQLPGAGAVDVFNLHLQAYENYQDVRSAQFERVAEVLKERGRSGVPAILMGDLNVIAGSQEHKNLKKLLKGFKDTWELKGEGPGYTWNPDKNPFAQHEGESAVFQRLDYIFIKNGREKSWKVKEVKVDYDEKGNILSDHFGVTARLELVGKK